MKGTRKSRAVAAAAAVGVLILGAAAPALAAQNGNGPHERSASQECTVAGGGSHTGPQGERRGEANSKGVGGRHGQGRPDHAGKGQHQQDEVELGSLTEAQQAEMTLYAEEEKMARDLYAAFAEAFSDSTFERISQSEERHLSAVQSLLSAYGIADPTAGVDPGTFSTAQVQETYDAYLQEGLVSLEAARSVGAKVEEADIQKLRESIEGLAAPRAELVYSHLLRGSERHLSAMTR
jgi:hypothetical protein